MAVPPQAGPVRAPGGKSAVGSRIAPRIVILKTRPEFLATRKGGRWATPLFVVESIRRSPLGGETSPVRPRFGFTVSKQVGGAVERNRIKRRLREAVACLQQAHADPSCDYVLIARRAALDAPFATILSELAIALERASQIGRPKARDKSRGAKAPPKRPVE